VTASGKSDFIENEPEARQETVVIVPAAVNLKAEDPEVSRQQLALAPSPRQVEKAIKLKRSAARDKGKDKDTKKEIAQRRAQMAENCLARAIYFEARSESELGQIAVAKVVLNRVKDPEYPNTICGVVYQGSGRRNSCQFSFACDGLPDDVKSASSWAQAKRLAKKTIAGDAKVAALTTATNYHADYVKPKWAKSMKRLTNQDRPPHLLRRIGDRPRHVPHLPQLRWGPFLSCHGKGAHEGAFCFWRTWSSGPNAKET
jgi:spore germination cell wall hydrolase CwlJ-like protein